MKYTVVIEKAPGNYAAYAPDLPGCVAAAETKEEVMTLMRQAVALHIETLRQEGVPVPQPQAWAVLVDA